MRPCDCKDQYSVENELNEAGIAFNDQSITVQPSIVILKIGACTIKIYQDTFKKFAEWYLEDQSPGK